MELLGTAVSQLELSSVVSTQLPAYLVRNSSSNNGQLGISGSGFGGGSDDLRKLLIETQSAVAHNKKLISDAQNIILQADDIHRREDAVSAREKSADEKWQQIQNFKTALDAMANR